MSVGIILEAQQGEAVVEKGHAAVIAVGRQSQDNPPSRISWLHRDALIAALDREIDAETNASALTHEARQMAEAEVFGRLSRRPTR